MFGNHFCPTTWVVMCRFVTRKRRFKIMDDAQSAGSSVDAIRKMHVLKHGGKLRMV